MGKQDVSASAMDTDEVKIVGRTAVNNGRPRLVIFLLRAPHILEGRQRRQDGAADPDRVLAFRGSDYADLYRPDQP